jgi:hypothetical protein
LKKILSGTGSVAHGPTFAFAQNISKSGYCRSATLGTTNRPVRQHNDKEQLSQWPLDRVRKAYQPKWDRLRPKFLSLQCADLYAAKGRHEIGSDFSRFLFRYGVGRILITSLKDVFERNWVGHRVLI